VSACPTCGHQNQAGAKFCSECGAALAQADRPAREERKVVTVLFADLVGFTSRAEQMDPEDVRALLSPLYARLRSELERFGGTVEKFIGDAVMALFGAPVAHEDDPERAVRAALAIRDWVAGEGRVQVRLAVNTGEALVVLGARPAEGEGMAAGDVVNTAARLQAAAPVNGILVGGRTFRETWSVIEYREAAPVAAKGKKEPVPVWEAVRARGRPGAGFPSQAGTVLVGRDRELGVLRDALDRVRAERSAQLVTVVGVPGIGKSRLLYELWQDAGAGPEPARWRLGRSLPYGEGVSFWALAEMVKAQAGILETDTAGQAEAKLAQLTADVIPGASEADWVRRHLGALAGVGSGGVPAGGDQRGEAFAAWRYFVEALAEQRPLVLVFEDLHWADDGLLDFVDYLVDWAGPVPLLVIGSARPELLERRPAWGGGKPNAVTLSLSPLSDDDTARLIGSLPGRPVLEAGHQQVLLAWAGGNPLYAEQYAQMLAERGGGPGLPVPESVQAIIGARLDLLAPADKRLLQDAAVVGKVFWPGAVAALGGGDARDGEMEKCLHGLERKQFVRRERRWPVAGETQYAFAHVLLRDVAYGQIPRAARAAKHLDAAGWIESLGRPVDKAEMLAHHYLSALDLARAGGLDTGNLAPRARPALHGAGDRALALNAFAAAAGYYRAALGLWPQDAREQRAGLLFRLAVALGGAGEDDDGAAMEQARSALLAAGDRAGAAEAEARLGGLWWLKGNRDRASDHLGRAQALVRDEPASAAKAYVLSELARYQMIADQFDAQTAQQALELAEELGLGEVRAHVLITTGSCRVVSGDLQGRVDIQRGLEIALAGNYLAAAVRGYTNLCAVEYMGGDLPEGLRLALEAERVAQRLGTGAVLRLTRFRLVAFWFELGNWDKCARAADEFLADSAARGPHYHDASIRCYRSWMRLARGDARSALADQREALVSGRQVKDPQVLYPVMGFSAYLLAAAGRADEAQPILSELFAVDEADLGYDGESWFADCVLAAEMLGRRDEARQWLGTRCDSPWFVAARALADREFVAAAELLDSMGAARSAALARLRAVQELARTGRPTEDDDQLQLALDFFRSVDAARFIREAESLLAGSA
jgi:class 3 adenylate cyclase/tetratricopeptide (TPR) repeat protein